MNYTPEEAAKNLGVCKVTILRRIRDGSLPAIKYSKRIIKIEEAEIQKFIDKHRTNAS